VGEMLDTGGAIPPRLGSRLTTAGLTSSCPARKRATRGAVGRDGLDRKSITPDVSTRGNPERSLGMGSSGAGVARRLLLLPRTPVAPLHRLMAVLIASSAV
jgi:hypothetical protein